MAIPFATSLTLQTACKAPSRRVAAKSGACCIALLGLVGRATTCVARLAIVHILACNALHGGLVQRFSSLSRWGCRAVAKLVIAHLPVYNCARFHPLSSALEYSMK